MEHIYQPWQLNPMAHSADGTMTKPFLERLHKCTAKADCGDRVMEVSALLFANGLKVMDWPKDTQGINKLTFVQYSTLGFLFNTRIATF